MTNNVCVWLEGLPDAGKSTVAIALQKKIGGYILDGDDLRKGLNQGLGFSINDRIENVRRTAHAAKMLWEAGVMPIVAITAPMQLGRDDARGLFPRGRFIEVWLATPLHVCESRDTKGIYKRARNGEIKDMVGLDIPFEVPGSADLVIDEHCTVGESVSLIEEQIALTLIAERIWTPSR